MVIDDLAEEFLSETKTEISNLNYEQNLLFGYLALMRQLPYYIVFAKSNPECGNEKLANRIFDELTDLILEGDTSNSLANNVNVLNDKYIPDMDDFGEESGALEGSLGLIFLHKYSVTHDVKFIYEIYRGRIECILMYGTSSEQLTYISIERGIRERQFGLIKASINVTESLLERCVLLNNQFVEAKSD